MQQVRREGEEGAGDPRGPSYSQAEEDDSYKYRAININPNSFAILSDGEEEDEEEAELKEQEKKKEEKRLNEEGGKTSPAKEAKAEVCKSFRYGGKCPHGMSGLKKYNQWDKCNKAHPKVCNKLLTHGTRGCNGKQCEKFHPQMYFASMNTKRCTKEKCTYWHCKGTSFTPEPTDRYEAPSRASPAHYPTLPGRHSRSPVRRGQEEGGGSRR